MSFLFGEKKSVKQKSKEAQREIKRNARGIERDARHLKREEAQLEKEIRACLKRGDKRSATTLAKALVKNRHMQNRMLNQRANMTALKYEVGNMATQHKMADVMGKTASTMKSMNKAAGIQQTKKVLQEFQREQAKMAVSSEMMDDVFDMMDGEGVEGESDAVVDKVLDELGIEMGAKMDSAPSNDILASLGMEEEEGVSDAAAKTKTKASA